jgi:hypothetical protein
LAQKVGHFFLPATPMHQTHAPDLQIVVDLSFFLLIVILEIAKIFD